MVGAARIVLGLVLAGSFVNPVAAGHGRADTAPPAHELGTQRRSRVSVDAETTQTPTTVALRFFDALPPGDVEAALRAMRPPQIDDAERRQLLATLPGQGELSPDAGEKHKLAALKRVLTYHDRHGVLDVKVIDLPQAGVVFYHRAALLVTRPTLDLLSAAELQAAVAHEIGHEYFRSEFENPRLAGSAATRYTLELKCDGIAALTLLGLGLDVSSLTSAMRKTIEFNERLGVTTDTMGYPTVSERESFVRALLKMTTSRRQLARE
jgi:hypothetical protein